MMYYVDGNVILFAFICGMISSALLILFVIWLAMKYFWISFKRQFMYMYPDEQEFIESRLDSILDNFKAISKKTNNQYFKLRTNAFMDFINFLNKTY